MSVKSFFWNKNSEPLLFFPKQQRTWHLLSQKQKSMPEMCCSKALANIDINTSTTEVSSKRKEKDPKQETTWDRGEYRTMEPFVHSNVKKSNTNWVSTGVLPKTYPRKRWKQNVHKWFLPCLKKDWKIIPVLVKAGNKKPEMNHSKQQIQTFLLFSFYSERC